MKARVRMYQAGLGDCFLLSFWEDDDDSTPKHVLVDCGVLLGTPNGKEVMGRVVAHVGDETGAHLHAIVGTHEHWDHISGFNQARDAFDALEVDEVWLGWTEDPDDAQAEQLRSERALKIAGLEASLRAWESLGVTEASQGKGGTVGLTVGVLSFFGELGATGRRSTKDAQRYLNAEKACERRRFLEPGQSFAVRGVKGLRVFVLGPPRDETMLEKDRPSTVDPETYHLCGPGLTHEESLLAAASCGPADAHATSRGDPFDPFFRIGLEQAQHHQVLGPRYFQGGDWRKIDADWLESFGDIALALDNDTNNTSLVLAFELGDGGDVILMAGDAQVGNWLSWSDVEFRYRVGDERRRVSAPELLARVVLYKVGHHASHNATLREGGLEAMVHEGLVAMIPVDEQMAAHKGWAMPFGPLLTRLQEKTRGRILRVDHGLPAADQLQRLGSAEREAFVSATRQGLDADGQPLFVEIELRTDPG